MINRTTKLRWRRRLKRSRLQVEDYNQSAEIILEKNFFKRLNRLSNVKRFIITWVGLLAILISITIVQSFGMSPYYQKLGYVPGGSFYEGAVGSYTNVNPLFATGDVNNSVSALLFPGLFKFNSNDQLVGALAKSWSVDSTGQQYTINLKPNLVWQDGQPLTAADVVFTYQTIENPDVGSSLFNDWYGVKVVEVNHLTVKFTLPSPLSSFPNSLTNGIIPKHILQSYSPEELKSVGFNSTSPIGSGPFKLFSLSVKNQSTNNPQEQIVLAANPLFYGGRPKIDDFYLITYQTQKDMTQAFQNQDIQAMIGLDSLPSTLSSDPTVVADYIPVTAETMVFYRNEATNLNNSTMRKALSEAIDVNQVIATLPYPALPSTSPFLPFQFAYNQNYNQLTNNLADANILLDSLGWKTASDGYRYNNGQELTFSLYTQNTSVYDQVANSLINQWRKIGVNVQLVTLNPLDIESVIANKNYDMILYSISIGVDPDVFAYWDSAQAQASSVPGLNLSQYSSSTADTSLAAGRTVLDPALRNIKYQTFLKDWQSDYPALDLYQPNYLFVTRPKIDGFNSKLINTDTDIYTNINNWETRQVEVTNK